MNIINEFCTTTGFQAIPIYYDYIHVIHLKALIVLNKNEQRIIHKIISINHYFFLFAFKL